MMDLAWLDTNDNLQVLLSDIFVKCNLTTSVPFIDLCYRLKISHKRYRGKNPPLLFKRGAETPSFLKTMQQYVRLDSLTTDALLASQVHTTRGRPSSS